MRRIPMWCLLGATALGACYAQRDGNLSAYGGADAGGGVGHGGASPGTASDCGAAYSPGHTVIHRLTNTEYNNTVGALLYTKATPATAFDPSPAGASGFSNDSNALIISDDLIAAYYASAEALAKGVIATKGEAGGAYAQIVSCAPSDACATTVITKLATRAYRRPVTSDEVAALVAVYRADTDFDAGIADAITAMLVNPKFIFVYAAGPYSRVPDAAFEIDDFALAARLSYALWQTMPDDTLSSLAGAGKLHEPATLEEQVARMLKDGRASAMVTSLRNDWAGLATLADPSGSLVGLSDQTRFAMVGEADAFLSDLVASDKSFLDVLVGESTFVNGDLATYYGIPFTGADPAKYVAVTLPADRSGLVTSAAILTATAGDVAYTHPVHRGRWLAEKITCTPPSPPPPGVPRDFPDPSTSGQTPREALASHTANPACAGCHVSMDAFGLGLENYDSFGKWRTTYPGLPGVIDATGTLPDPDEQAFSNGPDMYAKLATDDGTRACLAEQLMAYTIARGLMSPDDYCIARQVGAATVTPTGSFSSTMKQIVLSRQFLMQTGEAP